MALILRNDEQIKVGTTPGLIAGSSSFTFDGTGGKPDYRNYDIVPSELTGRGILVRGLDYSWDSTLGIFIFLQAGDIFTLDTYYNIHFQALLGVPGPFDYHFLIDSTFFIRNINLPNLGDTAVLERLNYFIQKYEPECLKTILGKPLYALLLTETSARMTELIYGTGYMSPSGFERFWDGLVHDINISLIANYIYYYFQEANALQTTGVATKASRSEGGDSASPNVKMINAWRFFGSETRSLCSFLWNKKDDSGVRVYPEFTSYHYNTAMELARPGGVNFFGF